MFKVVSVDNGRSFNKSFCNNKSNVFQSVMAPAEDKFNLTVDTRPTDLWIEYEKENWLIGDLAIRQRPKKVIQDRDSNKCNQQNLLQTLAACSLYAKNENLILLANVPARDYSEQKEIIQDTFKGTYKIIHKAGDMAGVVSEFYIDECIVLPEGECGYYGTVYDLNLNVVNKDILNNPCLILDFGDQTTNYISMNPGGEPQDDASGSLDASLHDCYADLKTWLTRQGVDISLPELTHKVIYSEPIFTGNQQVFYGKELQKRYAEFERTVYSELDSILSLKRYRNLILIGGGAVPLRSFIENRFSFLAVHYTAGSQLLNCYGAHIIYWLTRG
jgi:hypothetical protein